MADGFLLSGVTDDGHAEELHDSNAEELDLLALGIGDMQTRDLVSLPPQIVPSSCGAEVVEQQFGSAKQDAGLDSTSRRRDPFSTGWWSASWAPSRLLLSSQSALQLCVGTVATCRGLCVFGLVAGIFCGSLFLFRRSATAPTGDEDRSSSSDAYYYGVRNNNSPVRYKVRHYGGGNAAVDANKGRESRTGAASSRTANTESWAVNEFGNFEGEAAPASPGGATSSSTVWNDRPAQEQDGVRDLQGSAHSRTDHGKDEESQAVFSPAAADVDATVGEQEGLVRNNEINAEGRRGGDDRGEQGDEVGTTGSQRNTATSRRDAVKNGRRTYGNNFDFISSGEDEQEQEAPAAEEQ
ncbi:unnamed protein product [Amoebophrya sp. A120]|nr:unnamed protein product [Amoebophrya sp. A120]|eukprot:GSA120T00019532001.1